MLKCCYKITFCKIFSHLFVPQSLFVHKGEVIHPRARLEHCWNRRFFSKAVGNTTTFMSKLGMRHKRCPANWLSPQWKMRYNIIKKSSLPIAFDRLKTKSLRGQIFLWQNLSYYSSWGLQNIFSFYWKPLRKWTRELVFQYVFGKTHTECV